MIQLLFTLVFAEMTLIVLFVFKTPPRKLVIMGLDRVKRGRGPIVVKTVAGTIFIVMMSSLYNVVMIQRRWVEDGEVNPTDQILLAKNLLEASLMVGTCHNYTIGSVYFMVLVLSSKTLDCRVIYEFTLAPISKIFPGLRFSLFLALMVDRLHHYIRELRIRRKTMEAVKKQSRVVEDGKPPVSEEIKALEEEKTTLHGRIKQLETQLEEKVKAANNSEANAVALKKQSEGFLLEYDRLLEENQNLRSQLQSLDRRLSHSNSKKVM